MSSQSMNLQDYRELIKLKREKPDEYKSFLKQMIDISMDMVEIAGAVVKERQDKITQMQKDLSDTSKKN